MNLHRSVAKHRGIACIKALLPSNTLVWTKKIRAKMKTTILVNEQLGKEGWMFLRFWAADISPHPIGFSDDVMEIQESLKRKARLPRQVQEEVA